MRGSPIKVYGIKETLDILRAHLFNWKIWPDFTQIPDAEKPFMAYREITVGERIELRGAHLHGDPGQPHGPAVGYSVDNGRNALIYSGDTSTNDAPVESGEQPRRPEVPDHRDRVLQQGAGHRRRPRSTCARRSSPRSWRRCA
jgi:hypothetical protein